MIGSNKLEKIRCPSRCMHFPKRFSKFLFYVSCDIPILTICKHKMQVFQQGSRDQWLKLCCKFCSSTNSLEEDNPRSKQQAKQLTNETRNIQHIGHIILQAGVGAAKRATRPSILSKLAAVEKGKNQRTWFHWTMKHMNSGAVILFQLCCLSINSRWRVEVPNLCCNLQTTFT